MCPLNNPPSCFLTCSFLDVLCLFAARAHMHSVPKFSDNLSNFIANISCIHAQMLLALFCWLRTLDRYAFKCLLHKLAVMPISSCNCDADRYAICVRQKASLRPFFARSVGLAPVASPPSGDFVIAPSIDCHFHLTPLEASYSSNPCFHICSKTPASAHS